MTLALREQAEAEAATAAALSTSTPKPTRRRARKPGPARTAVIGRPTTPDEPPLAHAPAAGRPGEPPLRTTTAMTTLAPPTPAPPAAHRSRRRIELGATTTSSRTSDPTARPRPSRVLAELHAALADEAAAAE